LLAESKAEATKKEAKDVDNPGFDDEGEKKAGGKGRPRKAAKKGSGLEVVFGNPEGSLLSQELGGV